MNAKYRIIVEGDNASNYSAYSPDVPGVVATGSTRDECERELLNAIEFHLEGVAQHDSLSTPLLALESVSKRYMDGSHEIVVLDQVSLDIHRGTVVGIWGTAGSGKSTLLHLMSGIEVPSAGKVLFEGHDLQSLSTTARAEILRSRVALVSMHQWPPGPTETVLDHVAMSAASSGLTLRDARSRATIALDRVKLGERATAVTSSLSMLERMSFALARALVREPVLLLVDEPAASHALDTLSYLSMLHEVASEQAMTLVVASQYMSSLVNATVLVAIVDGKLSSSTQSATIIEFPKRGIA